MLWERIKNVFLWYISPLPLLQYPSTCSEDNYNSDPTSNLMTTIVSAGVCERKHLIRRWSVVWSRNPDTKRNQSVWTRGCTACHVFAVFLHGSVWSLHVISHTSASLSAAIGGCTAEDVCRYGFKQITSPQSYWRIRFLCWEQTRAAREICISPLRADITPVGAMLSGAVRCDIRGQRAAGGRVEMLPVSPT